MSSDQSMVYFKEERPVVTGLTIITDGEKIAI